MVEKTKKKSDDKRDKISCSKCNRNIPPKEHYIQDALSGEITCAECEDNRILIKGDNFFSID